MEEHKLSMTHSLYARLKHKRTLKNPHWGLTYNDFFGHGDQIMSPQGQGFRTSLQIATEDCEVTV